MSVLQDTETQQNLVVPPWVKMLLSEAFYEFLDKNRHDVLLQRKVLFFTVTITVGDCERFLEMLIGPRPQPTPTS